MEPNTDLLAPGMWPDPVGEGFQAMRVLAGTGPRNEVLRILGGVSDPRVYRPVRKELAEAVACLEDLDASDRIGVGYGGKSARLGAIAALNNLSAALEAEAEDVGVELPPLRDYLDDPPRLRADLRESIADYLWAHVAEDLERLRTFSVILCRDTDLGGTVATSLVEQRAQWRDALTPDDTSPDLHLAVIPPPTAAVGIAALATELHCLRQVPCVVFLGDKPDRTLRGEGLLSRLSVRRLHEPPPDIPGQLRTIYRTVYHSPTAAGSLWMATGDKYFQLARERLNPKVALTLLVGAIGGPIPVAALTTVFDLFTK
jgi:hypothetical protein